jgi:hypothetical protein
MLTNQATITEALSRNGSPVLQQARQSLQRKPLAEKAFNYFKIYVI